MNDSKYSKKIIITVGAVFLGLMAIASIAYYFVVIANRVYIEKSEVNAPEIHLSASASGALKEVLVNEGDVVVAHQSVARVGDELVKTQVAGIITATNANIGAIFNPGQTVVSMVDSRELRIVGHIDEDKGLSDIHIGDPAVFTIDALGGEEFHGVVDAIGASPRQADVVFNISDKRQIRQFDVKVRYDEDLYPQIKQGMSARIWIYKR